MCVIPMRRATSVWIGVSIFITSGCSSHPGSQQQNNQPAVDGGAGVAKRLAADPIKRHARNCDFSELRPLRMSDWLSHRGIAKRVEPVYPAEAKRRRLQGKISVRVLINRNGEVERACGNGHPLLRNAAEEAALQWLFRIPELNGNRIPYVEETLVFDFTLGGSPTPGAHPEARY